MKKPVFLTCLVIALCVSQATTVNDHFSRADTAPQTAADDPNAIGGHWTVAQGEWMLKDGKLMPGPTGVDQQLIILNAVPTYNTEGTNFTLQAVVQFNTPGDDLTLWAGVIFNYQDPLNFCTVRYCGAGLVQLVKWENGDVGGYGEIPSTPPITGRPYRITVSSTGLGIYSASIDDAITGENMGSITDYDLGGGFANGYGGVHSGFNTGYWKIAFDNFSLEVGPEIAVPPLLLALPTTASANPGGQLALTADIGGNPLPQVQWKFEGQDIPGATDLTLIVDNFQAANVGGYSLAATNSSGGLETPVVDASFGSRFADDFNRADTLPQDASSVPNAIGSAWNIFSGEWAIHQNQLAQAGNTTGELMAYINSPATMSDGSGGNFTLTATLQLDSEDPTGFVGLIFNAAPGAGNTYVLRYNGQGTVQLIGVLGGAIGPVPLSVENAFIHVQNRPYRVTVASESPNAFTVQIYDTVADMEVYTTTVADGGANLVGGSGGVYAFPGFELMRFDDFNLTVQPWANQNPSVLSFTTGALTGLPQDIQIIGGQYAPTDPDGDALTVIAVTPSVNGGTVTTDGSKITYTSAAAFTGADSFDYTVSDGQGGAATGTITVNVIANSAAQNRIVVNGPVSDGTIHLAFQGIPSSAYVLDWTSSLAAPVTWTSVSTNLTDATGVLEMSHTTATPENFYRLRKL